MNNTTLSAKNTFLEGLIMDFSPDNTSASSLTSALNATLITFNGNEMALQNDMGNGRVETAYLPEGFIPVGTCEFGDIIYIVSYNPLTNKSLIGCFPSPERNISSEEIGNLDISLTANDFLEINELGELTGVLKASSCKKILFEKNLNPGDKYIIYSKNDGFNKNNNYVDNFTDYGNTSHIYGKFPKLIKVHVVAIEDSNKINFLDSTVKWYSSTNEKDYIIQNSLNLENGKPDLDSYRKLVSSNYSIFQSKVSGKLALLVELEKITGFSCTTDIYSSKSNITSSIGESSITGKQYDVYWNISWNTENNNINPKYIVLTKSQWTGKELKNYGKWFYYTKNNNKYEINYTTNSLSVYTGDYASNSVTSFRDINGNLNNSYWFAEINRQYEPENYKESYEHFIKLGSYDAKEKSFIDLIKTSLPAYNELNLNKINIVKDQDGKPNLTSSNNGNYYINAHHIDKNEYYTSLTTGSYAKISPVEISDDIVNNYFKSSIYKKFHSFNIPTTLTFSNDVKLNLDISNLIYKYALTPAMPYGLLEEFTLEGYIDFSKIGSGEIKLTNWRYYNTENISTLTLGLEIYPEPNKGVSEVVIDFYDNQGPVGSYHISNKNSYSGIFTEYIPLNGVTSNYKLNTISSEGKEILHLGTKPDLNNDIDLVYKASDKIYKVFKDGDSFKYVNSEGTNVTINDTDNIYKNDAGVIYSNIVYLTKIVVKYDSKNSLGEYLGNEKDYKTFYRWFWTNNIFNEYYYSTLDFNNLLAVLDLDINALYSSTGLWQCERGIYSKGDSDLAVTDINNTYANLSATYLSINQKLEANEEGNINSKITIGLQNTYNTFTIAKSVGLVNKLSNFKLEVVLGKSYIDNSPEKPSILNTDLSLFDPFEGIYPTYENIPTIQYSENIDKYGLLDSSKISKTLFKKLGIEDTGIDKELWDDSENYKNYLNKYSLNIAAKYSSNISLVNEEYKYISEREEDLITLNNYVKYESSLDKIYEEGLNFYLTGIHFSKYNKEGINTNILANTLVPLINTPDDLRLFGLELVDNKLLFSELLTIGTGWMEKGSTTIEAASYILNNYYFNKDSVTYWDHRKDSGTNNGYALVNKANGSIKLYLSPLNNLNQNVYIRDLLSSDIGIILLCKGSNMEESSSLTTRVSFVKNNTNSKYSVREIYKNKFGDIGNINKTPPSVYLNSSTSGDCAMIMGLVMKDISGEIHILNNLFSCSNAGGLTPLVGLEIMNNINLGAGQRYIGNMIGGILSNLFIKSDYQEYISVNKVSNIIYLEDNLSSFYKDLIYTVSTNTLDINDLILILGVSYKSYIEQVKTFIKGDCINNNVDFKLNSVLKNIPIQFSFNYIQPSKNILNLYGDTIIRLGENDNYTTISVASLNNSKLFTIERTEEGIIVLPAIKLSCPTVESVSVSEDSNRLIFKYDDSIIHENSLFSKLFTYENNSLRLTRTVNIPSDIVGYTTIPISNMWNTQIAGIVLPEYLTNYLRTF